MSGTAIQLQSGDVFAVTLTYDGATLTETITDQTLSTHPSFTTSYAVNIASIVSSLGYVGFGGGTGGLTTVADVQTWRYSFTQASPQLAAGGPAASGAVAGLTQAGLAPVAREAVANWAATGLSAAQVAELQAVQYQIGALGGGALGLTVLGAPVVRLDATAAGYGWFLDPSQAGDSAFASLVSPTELLAAPGSPAFGRMDLLTVVEHELGHVLGLSDLDPQAVPNNLLTTTLAPGVRRLPTPTAEAVPPAVEALPAALPAALGAPAPAAPVLGTPAAEHAAEAAAESLDFVSMPAAEAPAESLVVTVSSVPTAATAPAADEPLSAAGDALQPGTGLGSVEPALSGALPPALGQSPSVGQVIAPLLADDTEVGGESAVTALPALKTDWLHSVDTVPAEGDPAAAARNALFARLGDQEALPELLGDDPGAW